MIYIMLLIPMFLLIGGIIAWIVEIRIWNNGICRKTNERWEWFDNDSQGGRGYSTQSGRTCWISYPLVDKNYKKEQKCK